MRVLICGDRNWNDIDRVREVVKEMHGKSFIDVVIEGEAPGADTHGAIIANELGIPVEKYPADWKKYGRAAGPIRNKKMLDDGKSDIVLAFHNHLLHSKGTKNMCTIAKKAGVRVLVAHSQGQTEIY